ncbi:hypothetical protein FDUTEX481_00991 [Tolypothrix sp. PCC 7601]|nr:hypothetical protein FDUTEX481_00991 [Tolypothrix sp. PCC 7601]BAY91983.1 hypothetical protein NIES3275_40140 [Microchaete diplosiphon NIES-3275]
MAMSANSFTIPKFSPGETVEFIGGMGMIVKCSPNSATWAYYVEMQMGDEPEMGRIGYETTILLLETDIASLATQLIAA